jgi:preprotein translocase subunit YajC
MKQSQKTNPVSALAARLPLVLAGLLLAGPAAAQGAPGGGGFELIFIVVMMVVFYFFLIRPQTKRAKEHRELVAALAKGDEVVTAGGMLGKVNKVTDDYVVIEIANNLEIKMQKQSIQATLPKGTIKSI